MCMKVSQALQRCLHKCVTVRMTVCICMYCNYACSCTHWRPACMDISQARHGSAFVCMYQELSMHVRLLSFIEGWLCAYIRWPESRAECISAFMSLYRELGSCIKSWAGVCMCLQVVCVCMCLYVLSAERVSACVCTHQVLACVLHASKGWACICFVPCPSITPCLSYIICFWSVFLWLSLCVRVFFSYALFKCFLVSMWMCNIMCLSIQFVNLQWFLKRLSFLGLFRGLGIYLHRPCMHSVVFSADRSKGISKRPAQVKGWVNVSLSLSLSCSQASFSHITTITVLFQCWD